MRMTNNYFNEERCKKISMILLMFFTIFISIIVWKINPYISGDGAEYLLQTEAWYNHGTMDIREIDKETSIVNYNSDQAVEIWKDTGGRFITEDGRDFAPHFGGYSLLVLPIKLLLKALGFNQLRSFQLTNGILYLSSLFFVYYKLKTIWKNKMLLLVLLMCNPVLYYITWTHTEVFSFSLLILGLIYFYNKQHKLSALFISISAMQNPAVIFIGLMIGIDYLVSLYKAQEYEGKININRVYKFIKKNIVDFILMGMCYVPFFIPLLHTYINFKKLNLVSTVARESNYMFEKAFNYIFDLNLGILPYVPIVLILYLIFILIGLKKDKYYAILNLIAILGMLYVISNQRQINSGMSGIMRYNVWIIPMMIFYVILHKDILFNEEKSRKLNIIIPFSAVITSIIIIINGGVLCKKFNCLEFSPIAKIVLDNAPSIYNPTHGIFISRATHKEGYSIEEPVIYNDKEGFVRKILVTPQVKNELLNMHISGSDEAKEYFYNEVKKVNINKTYQYINIGKKYNIEIKNTVDSFNAADYIGQEIGFDGIYGSEGEFCWVAPEASIYMFDKNDNSSKVEFGIIISDLLKKYNSNKPLRLDILINEKLIKSIDLNSTNVNEVINIELNKNEFPYANSKLYKFSFITNSYFNPKVEGINNDDRKLSFQLKYIRFI